MLIDDPALREDLSRRAYARALNFDTGTMARAYLDTYADAIALRRGQCVS
jgi:glycosyltransferase involved in cell wall biosynthesis